MDSQTFSQKYRDAVGHFMAWLPDNFDHAGATILDFG